MIFEELKRKRPAEDDRFEGGTNVLRFLKDFNTCVESVYGVTAQDKYDELVLWAKGKAQLLAKSFRDFDDITWAVEVQKGTCVLLRLATTNVNGNLPESFGRKAYWSQRP